MERGKGLFVIRMRNGKERIFLMLYIEKNFWFRLFYGVEKSRVKFYFVVESDGIVEIYKIRYNIFIFERVCKVFNRIY